MKLFYKPGACSLASHITLRESGKDFTLDGVDLMKKRLENGDDFFAVNPKGQVPALLLDDGTLLTEGVAIMQYRRTACQTASSLPLPAASPVTKPSNGLTTLRQNCIKALRHCSVPIRRKTLSQPFARCWRKNAVCERLAER